MKSVSNDHEKGRFSEENAWIFFRLDKLNLWGWRNFLSNCLAKYKLIWPSNRNLWMLKIKFERIPNLLKANGGEESIGILNVYVRITER